MLLIIVTLLATGAPALDADATETLLRAVAYDRNLEARTAEGFRLGVAFDPRTPDTEASARTFAATITAVRASGSELAPEWVEPIGVEDANQLYRWLKENQVTALFVPDEMRASVPEIVTAAEAAGVFTLAGSPADVEDGLVVGVRVAGASKKLVVNMGAASRCGVDFDAVVRQVAERVGDAPAKDHRDQLEDALGRYTAAIEARDLDALRSVWPALEGDDERRVVASFKMARSHTVSLAVLTIDGHGDRASARVRRVDRLVTKDGQRVTAGTLVDIAFSKTVDGTWRILSMANARPIS